MGAEKKNWEIRSHKAGPEKRGEGAIGDWAKSRGLVGRTYGWIRRWGEFGVGSKGLSWVTMPHEAGAIEGGEENIGGSG